MRKLYLLAVAIVMVSASYAQTTSGNLMVGGGFGISSETTQSNDDYKRTTFTFSPSVGYFVIDNLAVGLNLGIGSTKEDDGNVVETTTSTRIGPFARYYIYTSNKSFAFYGQAGLDIISSKYETDPGGETKSGGLEFAVRPGFSYFFNEHWALDLNMNLLSYTSEDLNKDVDDDKENTVSFGFNTLNPQIGIRYHFGVN